MGPRYDDRARRLHALADRTARRLYHMRDRANDAVRSQYLTDRAGDVDAYCADRAVDVADADHTVRYWTSSVWTERNILDALAR